MKAVKLLFVLALSVILGCSSGGCAGSDKVLVGSSQNHPQRLFDNQNQVQHLLRSTVAVIRFLDDGGAGVIGTAFFVGPNGTLMTAAHVAYSKTVALEELGIKLDNEYVKVAAKDETVYFLTYKSFQKADLSELKKSSKLVYKARIVAINHHNDIAKLQTQRQHKPPHYLRVSYEELRLGQRVYGVGMPKHIPWVLTEGTVSNLSYHKDLLIIDINIDHGASGGPLVNRRNEVVGVASGMFGPHGKLGGYVSTDKLLQLKLDKNQVQ